MAAPETPIPWLVEPLIVKGDRVVVYGQWASFKSYFLTSLSLHLAAGRDFGPFKIAEPVPVLYLDKEMGERRFWRRTKQMATSMGLASKDLPLSLLPRGKCNFRFNDKGRSRLLEAIGAAGVQPGGVLIVESLRGFLDGSENDQEDLGRFWDMIDPLVEELRLTVIVSHHMRKPGKDRGGSQAHEASGSNLQMTGTDCAFSVVRDKVNPVAIVTQEKNRETEEYRPFTVAFTFSDTAIAVSAGEDVGPRLSPHQMTLWRYVAENPGATRKEAREGCKLAEATMTGVVNALVRKELIAEDKGQFFPLKFPPDFRPTERAA
jgi:hypothetical protein